MKHILNILLYETRGICFEFDAGYILENCIRAFQE